MGRLDFDAMRAQIRLAGHPRPSSEQVAMWREDLAESRANLAIEDMALSAEDDALFDLMRDERVPPPLATQILLRLLGHPDADPTLAITPAGASC